MDDGREIVDPRVGVPGISDIGSPGDVLTYRGPNYVPRFLPVTGAGLGNVSGPGTTTVGFVPTWSNTTGTLLSAGLPVSTAGAALSLVETDSGGKIAASTIPNSGVTPGTYTNATITVGVDGRLTAASSGAAAGIGDAPAGPTVYGRNTGNWLPVVPITGTTMTGLLTLSGPPTNPLHAATKTYADGLVVGLAPLNSPFFTGTPTAPNQPPTDDSTRLATTHFVKSLGFAVGAPSITLTGDVTGSGLSPIATTIANTVAAGTFQGITFNTRGLITAAVDQGYLNGAIAATTYLPLAGGTISGSTPGSITINRGATLPPPAANVTPVLWGLAAPGDPTAIVLDTIDHNPAIILRRANSGPSRVLNGQSLGQIAARGYFTGAASGYPAGGNARLQFTALQDFTDTAQGTHILLQTTPMDGALPTTQVTIGPGAMVGAPADPAGGMLIGDLNAQRVFQQGQPIATAAMMGGYLPLTGGTITGTAPGSITIRRGSTLPATAANADVALWLAGANTESIGLLVDSIGGLPALILRRANGTGTTAVAGGDIIGQISARAYGATHYSPTGNARIQFRAAETFTDNFQGTAVYIQTTPVGDNILFNQVTIGPGLTVGAPTPPSDGMQIGDVNGSRILQNGVPVTSGGGGGPTTLAGDVTGASTATTVVKLQSRNLASTAPLSGQVLGWNLTANQWEPTAAVTGSGGPPGGIDGDVQIKAGGAFGGIHMVGDGSWNTLTGVFSLTTPYLPLAGGTITGTSPGMIVVQRNPTLPSTAANVTTVLWAVGNATENPALVVDGVGGGLGTLLLRRSNAPSPIAAGNIIGQIAARGHDGTNYAPVGNARLVFSALETFTSTAQGAKIELQTTPIGGSTAVTDVTIGPGVQVGIPAGGDKGAGSLNAESLYIGGVLVTPGGTGSGTVGSGTGPQIAQYPSGTGTTVGGVTLSGDATIAAGGAMTIGAGRITLAKMEARGAATLLGNPTGGSATPVEITLGSGLAFSAGALTATGGATGIAGLTAGQIPIAGSAITITSSANLSGDVVSAPNTLATTIQPLAVTHAKMVSITAQRLIGNPTGATASRSEISLGTGLSFAGTVLNGAVGTVTSVGLTMPGTIWAVGGSPVGASGTLAVTVTGTSGGVPFFSSGTAMGTSGALIAHGVVLGGGAGNPPVTSAVGSTGQVLTGVTGGDPVWQAPGAGGVTSGTLSTIAYYNTTTTVAGNPHFTIDSAGTTILNANTAAPPTSADASILRVVGDGTNVSRIILDSIGANNAIYLRRANGTATTMSAVTDGQTLGQILFGGANGTAYSSNVGAQWQIVANGNWSGTANGASMVFSTTLPNTQTFGVRMTLGVVGGMQIHGTGGAAPTLGDMGVGTINVAGGYYVNGMPLTGGADTTTGSITASTTLTQVGATVLTSQFNIVTTAATTTGPPYAGVALPAGSAGIHCIVRNSGVNPISVYPANGSGAQINTLGATVPITVLPNSTAYFEAASTAQWFTVP